MQLLVLERHYLGFSDSVTGLGTAAFASRSDCLYVSHVSAELSIDAIAMSCSSSSVDLDLLIYVPRCSLSVLA
jgi:hypothetical protein